MLEKEQEAATADKHTHISNVESLQVITGNNTYTIMTHNVNNSTSDQKTTGLLAFVATTIIMSHSASH